MAFENSLRLFFILAIIPFNGVLSSTPTDVPGPSIIEYEPTQVVKNKQLTLICKIDYLGNPPASMYQWFRNDKMLEAHTTNKVVIDQVSVDISHFSCAGINEVGRGEIGHVTLNVLAAPNFIKPLPNIFAISEKATSISLTCQVECNPQCLVYWLRNSEILTYNNELYKMSVTVQEPNHSSNWAQSIVSTLSFNLTAWPEGHLRRNIDDADYTCQTTGNEAGNGVISTTKLHVEYSPENISLSKTQLDVPELTILYNITCNAVGSPKPTYKWFHGDQVLSTFNFLYTNYPITRNDSGDYTCIASNRHGNLSATLFINVIYGPECEVAKNETEKDVTLICRVIDANPRVVNYQWFLSTNNDTINETLEVGSGEISLALLRNNTEGNYTCVVRNSVGSSSCFISVFKFDIENVMKNETGIECEDETTETILSTKPSGDTAAMSKEANKGFIIFITLNFILTHYMLKQD